MDCGRIFKTYFRKMKQWKELFQCGKGEMLVGIVGACILLFCCFVFSFMMGYALGIGQMTSQPQYVHYYPDWQYQLNRSDPKEANIMETREFQVSLHNIIEYVPRANGIENLTELLRNVTGEKLKNGDTSIYMEYHYITEPCGHQFSELRKRVSYDLEGNMIENETSLGVNEDSHPHKYKAAAMAWDLSVNATYNSEEKIEQDVHVGFYKFNRKSKVKNLPTDYEIETCGDIMQLFPNAFATIGHVDKDVKVEKKPNYKAVWEYSYSGKMFFEILKYKFAWTLYYDTLENAVQDDVPPSSGSSEFSIRIYSPGEGYGPWQYEGLEYTASLYETILRFYGYEF